MLLRVIAVAVAGAAAGALVANAVTGSAARSRCATSSLGTLEFLRGGRHLKLDFRTCKVATVDGRLILRSQRSSADGRYVFSFKNPLHSASIAADGLPLTVRDTSTGAVSRIATTLPTPGFATWCGNVLTYVIDRGGREVTMGDGIASARPPGWRPTTVLPAGTRTSWNTIACRPGGGLAVAAGPAGFDSPFGQEHRSLWLVSSGVRHRLTHPPVRTSDEAPHWSADGRWLAFVRTTAQGRGTLYAVDVRTARIVGPIVDLGSTTNYFGTYGWASQTAWRR